MNGIRTTPPRPCDISELFPELAPLARTTTRLHPRPGSPSPYDSSVGGPLLWPASQPWLYCDKWHEGPVSPLVPVAQLYARDVPELRPPGRADLLQVLWCPSEHPPYLKPTTKLFWRTAADVSSVLTSPPTPTDVQYGYIPKPCVLSPEQVTEYPNFLELSEQLREKVNNWSTWRAAGIVMDDAYEEPQEYYADELSEAPGWKVGGWPPWGLTDPAARFCVNCGTVMAPLLTIASEESRDYRRGWVPTEDQGIAVIDDDPVHNPPGIQVSKGNHLQLYSCTTCSNHTTLIQ